MARLGYCHIRDAIEKIVYSKKEPFYARDLVEEVQETTGYNDITSKEIGIMLGELKTLRLFTSKKHHIYGRIYLPRLREFDDI